LTVKYSAQLVTSTSVSESQPRTPSWPEFVLPQYVSLLIGPPSTATAYASPAPVLVELQATWVAEGFSLGSLTGTRSEVSRQARAPPSADSSSGASQTSSSATKVSRLWAR
jgi:hypothetical protein